MSHPSTVSQQKLPASGRILELDALRGLAAVAVVLFHYTTRYEQLFGHQQPLSTNVPWGHYGVDLFFILSGFVILMTLERTANSLKFAWGRFSRLYPTYWAAAAVTFAVVSICGLAGQEVSVSDAIINTTMIQALLGASHIDGAYWSLQAELIFYGNMLLLYRLGAFRRPAATMVCWLALACGVHFLQSNAETVWPLGAGLLSKLTTIGSLEFIPLFGIGVLLYDARRQETFSWLSGFGFAACLFAIGSWEGPITLAIDASLAILLWLAVSRRLSVLAVRPFVWLGAISYSLYLTHQNIGYVFIRYFESLGVAPLAAIAMTCVLALGLASCLHYWVERPSMQLCRRMDFATLLQRVRFAKASP